MERLGAILGPLGGVLGPLGEVLGPLGRLLDPLEAMHNIMSKPNDFLTKNPSVPCLLGGRWEAKIDQNRTQNESKFKTIFKSEKVALQEPLGAVLGRSWGILEAILGSKFALR